VLTSTSALWLWLEASTIAVAYPALALGASRRPSTAAMTLAKLAAVLVGHAVVALIGWKLAGGPGDARGLLITRVLFAALALAGFGLGALLARARLEPGVAAAVAAVLMLLVVWGPATGQTLAATGLSPTAVRSLGFQACAPFAASVALHLDVIHAAGLYGLVPAANLEIHMTTWIWTAGSLALAGSMFTFVALAGRRRRAPLLAATLALVVGVAACGKKKDKEDKPVTTGSGAVTAGSGSAGATTGSGSAMTGSGSGSAMTGSGSGSAAQAGAPTAAALDAAINKGIDALVKARGADGHIGGHPGATAMAALAIATAGVGKDDPRLKPSLDVLATLAKPDGSIVDKEYPVYVTAISALAFQGAGAYPELVAKAQQWLADKQFAEKNKIDEKNVNYGGIGYGTDVKEPNADLSNLEFALDALKDSNIKDKDEVMKRAQRFIERCQNRTESNDQKWATNDGGFVYEPGESKAGGTKSTGSMTYAGLVSFLYTNVDAKDPRVQAAYDWVKHNFTVDENPGLGQKGFYFHLHMMARALRLMGERTLTDAEGRAHDWPVELAAKLIPMQKEDGTWTNQDGTYWESNPVMATSRAVLALAHARAAMK
jgi:squalene-hopene/tetraprenyl-beta-curcumene cyclase